MAISEKVQDNNRNMILPAQTDGGRVHHFQIFLEYLMISQPLHQLGIGIGFGVIGINPIYFGGFNHQINTQFCGPKCGAGIGGKEGIARSAGQNGHPSVLEVAQGPSPNERLANGGYLNRTEHPRRLAFLFENFLQSTGIDHSRQHPHIVRGRPRDLAFA